MNRDIKLIATDLDGTLVQDSHHISERNLAAVRRALEAGIHVVIATGRMHGSAAQFVQQLGLDGVPLISYNGAMVRVPGEPKPMHHVPLAAELAAEIVQHSVNAKYHLHYYLDDVMYVTHIEKWSRIYVARTGSLPHPVGDLRRFNGKSPTKLLLAAAPEDIDRLLPLEQKRFGDRCYVTRSMPEYLEFLNSEANKGNALRWLADHLGISPDQIMACGDMLNDLPLIEMAGIGVAMPSAVEEVRAAADFIPETEENGVAEAIEKFIL